MKTNTFEIEHWNKKHYHQFIKHLLTLSDQSYKTFTQRLIPNINKNTIIGIRLPVLRIIAKKIAQNNDNSFLHYIENKYYEETMIEGLVVAHIEDHDILQRYLDQFIKKVDNWAICDSFCNSLKIVQKNKQYYFHYFKTYINPENEYETRVALIIFLNYYIEEEYLSEIFQIVDTLHSEYYYTNMAIAWLLSMIYIKHKKETVTYLKNSNLNQFTYNKTIQKIIESNQVSKEEKNTLRKMKR